MSSVNTPVLLPPVFWSDTFVRPGFMLILMYQVCLSTELMRTEVAWHSSSECILTDLANSSRFKLKISFD